MRCPDCGARLTEIWMKDGKIVCRCSKCGGFWVDGWVVDRLPADQLKLWRRISIPGEWASGGKGMCPRDSVILERYEGECLPSELAAFRCMLCGFWWFPKDSLFSYKPAQEAKREYMRLWQIPFRLKELLLPIASIVVILAGLATVVLLLQYRQQLGIPAKTEIQNSNDNLQMKFK